MKIDRKELEVVLTEKYFIKYGYFSFKRRSNIIDEEYGIAASDMFSKDIWTMDSLYEYLKRNPKTKENIIERINQKHITVPIEIHGFKTKYTKRKFKFVNIYNYLEIIYLILDNRKEYEHLFLEDKNSSSKFFLSSFRKNNIRGNKDIRTKNKKYILKADISHFYHSIYTHTIPWVFKGKKEAKRNRGEGFFNDLDNKIQSSQDGETKGIPVGSFSSKFIAEIYQLKIDRELNERIKNIPFHRYVDDYNFYFNSENEKEMVLKNIYDIYASYELQINDLKVKEIVYPDGNVHIINLGKYFDNIYGTILSTIESDEFGNEKKANIISRYIYQYIELYQSTRKEIDLKMPIYFSIETFLQKIEKLNKDIYIILLDRNILFELINVFLLDMKYLQYFMLFIENIYVEKKSKIIEKAFREYSPIFNEKILYYQENDYGVELSYILTLQIKYPFFEIDKEILEDIIVNNDSITALLAFKILCRTYEDLGVKFATERIIKYKQDNKIFSFKNENFLFEYEIAWLCKNNESFRKSMMKSIDHIGNIKNKEKDIFRKRLNTVYSGNVSSEEGVIEKFYLELLKNNVRFMKIDS